MFKLESLESDKVDEFLNWIDGCPKAQRVLLMVRLSASVLKVYLNKSYDNEVCKEDRYYVGNFILHDFYPVLETLFELENKRSGLSVEGRFLYNLVMEGYEKDLVVVLENLHGMGLISEDTYELVNLYLCKHETVFPNDFGVRYLKEKVKESIEDGVKKFQEW